MSDRCTFLALLVLLGGVFACETTVYSGQTAFVCSSNADCAPGYKCREAPSSDNRLCLPEGAQVDAGSSDAAEPPPSCHSFLSDGACPEQRWTLFPGQVEIIDMVLGPDGDIYVAGIFEGDVDLGGESRSVDAPDTLVARITPEKEVVWVRFASSQESDGLPGVAVGEHHVVLTVDVTEAIALDDYEIPSASQSFGQSLAVVWMARESGVVEGHERVVAETGNPQIDADVDDSGVVWIAVAHDSLVTVGSETIGPAGRPSFFGLVALELTDGGEVSGSRSWAQPYEASQTFRPFMQINEDGAFVTFTTSDSAALIQQLDLANAENPLANQLVAEKLDFQSVDISSSGDVRLCGSFDAPATFGPSNLLVDGFSDAVLALVDVGAEGELSSTSAQRYGGGGSDTCIDHARTDDGVDLSVFSAPGSDSFRVRDHVIEPADGSFTHPIIGEKFGTLSWAMSFGFSEVGAPTQILALPDDRFVVAGTFLGTLELPDSSHDSNYQTGFLVAFDAP